MSSHPPAESVNPRLAAALQLRKYWFWFLILGIGLVLLGVVAITAQYFFTITSVLVFGILLLGGGIVEVVNAVLARCWKAFLVHLLSGVLHAILGFLMIEHPHRAAEILTLMLAVAFLISGAFRIVYVLIERFDGWPWVMLNGVVTLLLGLLIWKQWPESSYWVIGLFVGIDLIFNGWSWVMLALGLKSVPAAQAKTA
jgi:uncharacterized membrane protein HdeD (DUF308 family)